MPRLKIYDSNTSTWKYVDSPVAFTGSTSSSYSISSSYTVTASYALNGGGTASPSASWASSSISSSYSVTASFTPYCYQTEYIYIPATAMVSDATNGPQLFFYEASSGYNNIAAYAFDTSTDENVTALLRLPPYWNYTTPLKAKLVGFVNSGSSAPFVMAIKARGMPIGISTSTGSYISGSYGTEVSASIISRATATLCEWDSALTVTPTGVASANDMISIKIGRRTADVADTYGADVYFAGLMLEFIKTTGSWSVF